MVIATAAGQHKLFIDGRADAILRGPPTAQDFRAKKIGRVILNIGWDRPWEQYYCCMIAARTEFVSSILLLPNGQFGRF